MSDDDALEVFTVYCSPRDHPDKYVLRRWACEPGCPDPTPREVLAIADTIAEVRKALPDRGLMRFSRMRGDDPCIVETWM